MELETMPFHGFKANNDSFQFEYTDFGILLINPFTDNLGYLQNVGWLHFGAKRLVA